MLIYFILMHVTTPLFIINKVISVNDIHFINIINHYLKKYLKKYIKKKSNIRRMKYKSIY